MRNNSADNQYGTDSDLSTLLQRPLQTGLSDGSRAAINELVTALENEEVRASLDTTRVPKAGRKQSWLIAIPAVLIVIGLPTAALAINSWSVHTGVFGGLGTEVVDRSEWLGLDAEDAPAAIVDMYVELPLPPEAKAEDVIRPIAAMLQKMGTVPEGEAGHVLIQETAVQGLFERAARCLWIREWLDADTDGDDARRDVATLGISNAVDWPATVASDGGGVRTLLASQAEAAAKGDRSQVLTAYGKCSNFYGSVQE